MDDKGTGLLYYEWIRRRMFGWFVAGKTAECPVWCGVAVAKVDAWHLLAR
jgi:hypothetical protein